MEDFTRYLSGSGKNSSTHGYCIEIVAFDFIFPSHAIECSNIGVNQPLIPLEAMLSTKALWKAKKRTSIGIVMVDR